MAKNVNLQDMLPRARIGILTIAVQRLMVAGSKRVNLHHMRLRARTEIALTPGDRTLMPAACKCVRLHRMSLRTRTKVATIAVQGPMVAAACNRARPHHTTPQDQVGIATTAAQRLMLIAELSHRTILHAGIAVSDRPAGLPLEEFQWTLRAERIATSNRFHEIGSATARKGKTPSMST